MAQTGSAGGMGATFQGPNLGIRLVCCVGQWPRLIVLPMSSLQDRQLHVTVTAFGGKGFVRPPFWRLNDP